MIRLSLKSVAIALAISTSLLFTACAPPMVYYQKEKVIREQSVNPVIMSAPQEFHHNQAAGRGNVLWVVENTWTAEALFEKSMGNQSAFQKGYEQVAKALTGRQGALRFANFHGQVVLTPSNKMPANYLRTEGSLNEHLSDLFKVPANRNDKHGLLISSRESYKGDLREGAVSPTAYTSAAQGANDGAFKDRGDATLYVIFVLASGYNSPYGAPEKTVLDQIAGGRPLGSVKVINLVAVDPGKCAMSLHRPTDFLVASSQVGWSVSEINLCSDPSQWADQIVKLITKTQSQIRLNFTPNVPEDIFVYTTQGPLKPDVDYTYDGKTNSITITAKLADGELIYVRNFQRPTDGAK